MKKWRNLSEWAQKAVVTAGLLIVGLPLMFVLTSVPPVKIIDFGPKQIIAGEVFNRQPDGTAALWFKTKFARSGAVVLWNGIALSTSVGSEDQMSAIVPVRFFQQPQNIILEVEANHKKSNPLTLSIVPKHD